MFINISYATFLYILSNRFNILGFYGSHFCIFPSSINNTINMHINNTNQCVLFSDICEPHKKTFFLLSTQACYNIYAGKLMYVYFKI